MNEFCGGFIATAFSASALFFFRFWTRLKERLFLFFAGAFFMLALERLVLVVLRNVTEVDFRVYLLRLLAFVLILAGIADKNRAAR
jgi:hypothetical protein